MKGFAHKMNIVLVPFVQKFIAHFKGSKIQSYLMSNSKFVEHSKYEKKNYFDDKIIFFLSSLV